MDKNEELKRIIKKCIDELHEFADHWNREAESFDHPAMEQERRLALGREKDVKDLIKKAKESIK